MINKLMKKINKNLGFIVIGMIIIILLFILIRGRMERFTINDMLIPPLEEVSDIVYGYGCPINGYKCKPTLISRIDFKGKGPFGQEKYARYKILDDEKIIRYSFLYDGDSKLGKGDYIIFDNGQEYVITSRDTENEPTDCPAHRQVGLKQ